MTHHSLPALRNTRKHFNTMLWDHFKQQEHQKKKKHKNVKDKALKGLINIIVFIRAGTEDGVLPCLTLPENVKSWGVQVFCQSTGLEMTVKAPLILIWRLNLRWVEWPDLLIWKLWIIRIDYI